MSLSDLQEALKKKYTSEIELTHSKSCQEIIDHCKFSYDDLFVHWKRLHCVVSKDTTTKTSWSFKSTVSAVEPLINNGFKKFFYVFCKGNIIDYVIIFPIHYLEQNYLTLIKLDRLKAFM